MIMAGDSHGRSMFYRLGSEYIGTTIKRFNINITIQRKEEK